MKPTAARFLTSLTPQFLSTLILLALCTQYSALPLSSSGPSPAKWSDCGQGATTLTVKDVKVTPDPVVTGANFSLVLTCEGDDKISSGTFVTTVYLAGIQVHKQTDDICTHIKCPANAGAIEISQTTYMPKITPPGWYDVKVGGVQQDELPSICADIHFSVVI
mmetsp:Transcript_19474/g.30482  ORF Transcript_19474/g.30482 Transcript_19474/m.30482 type:complete len:163 (-) Transcript_19474:842-1330(-)